MITTCLRIGFNIHYLLAQPSLAFNPSSIYPTMQMSGNSQAVQRIGLFPITRYCFVDHRGAANLPMMKTMIPIFKTTLKIKTYIYIYMFWFSMLFWKLESSFSSSVNLPRLDDRQNNILWLEIILFFAQPDCFQTSASLGILMMDWMLRKAELKDNVY